MNTFSRYALHHSFRWAEEIIIYCAVWVTCVGASLTARADDHVTLDLLQELVKNPKGQGGSLCAHAHAGLLLPAGAHAGGN